MQPPEFSCVARQALQVLANDQRLLATSASRSRHASAWLFPRRPARVVGKNRAYALSRTTYHQLSAPNPLSVMPFIPRNETWENMVNGRCDLLFVWNPRS